MVEIKKSRAHPGKPKLNLVSGQRLPLRPVQAGQLVRVSARVRVDEAATLTVRVLDSRGRVLSMSAGSRVRSLAQRSAKELRLRVGRAATVEIRVVLPSRLVQPGARYRIVVEAWTGTGRRHDLRSRSVANSREGI